MNTYEERKQKRKEKLLYRAGKLREFANSNGLELFGEEKSGIPTGQPILVGHHSEKRHRKHLERINNRVRKGYEAHDKAERLEAAAEAIESRKAIDCDNPEALDLIKEKIAKLEKEREKSKRLNQLTKVALTIESLVASISSEFPDIEDPEHLANNLMEKDFSGRKSGIPHWYFANMSGQINRLKKRLVQVEKLNSTAFEPIVKNGVLISLVDSRIQIQFDEIPNEQLRNKLKSSPLSFKWSPKSKLWVRKHTPTTNSQYFKSELLKFAQEVENAKSIS